MLIPLKKINKNLEEKKYRTSCLQSIVLTNEIINKVISEVEKKAAEIENK